MLKFDRLGPGEKVKDTGYAAVLDAAKDLSAVITFGADDDVVGSCRLRYVGTGLVAEGHAAYKAEAASGADSKEITVADCKLEVKGVLEFVVPEGKTKLDVSHLVSGLVTADIDTDKSDDAGATAAAGVITLSAAAPAGGSRVVTKGGEDALVLATGPATTLENAAKVNVDPGDYQIHFIARAHDNVNETRMPNPTMLEFIRHCRPLNIRW